MMSENCDTWKAFPSRVCGKDPFVVLSRVVKETLRLPNLPPKSEALSWTSEDSGAGLAPRAVSGHGRAWASHKRSGLPDRVRLAHPARRGCQRRHHGARKEDDNLQGFGIGRGLAHRGK